MFLCFRVSVLLCFSLSVFQSFCKATEVAIAFDAILKDSQIPKKLQTDDGK